MAGDQFFRHAFDPRRVAGERLHCIGHYPSSAQSSGVIEIVSKCVTLSALVHSATLPALAKVLSSAVNSGLPSNDTANRSPSARSPSVCHWFAATLVLAPWICCRLPVTARENRTLAS